MGVNVDRGNEDEIMWDHLEQVSKWGAILIRFFLFGTLSVMQLCYPSGIIIPRIGAFIVLSP